jgi:hypothetical protein
MTDFRGIHVVVYDHHRLALCDAIHSESDAPLVYGGSAYLRFLSQALPRTRLHLLVAMIDGVPVGYLPLFAQSSTKGLIVINSSPFFGSHGGPIFRRSVVKSDAVVSALLAEAMKFAQDQSAASITIVENPRAPLNDLVLSRHGWSPVDDRIGQFTYLPAAKDMDTAQSALMEMFHVKTRNAIRKGQRFEQIFERRTDSAALEWLQEVHAKSIMTLGGIPKSREIFKCLQEHLKWDIGVRMYVGSKNGVLVSGLLLLLHGDTVEYFTPVVADIYKDKQILSALILHAMAEAVVEGRKVWNWGGTWHTQEGVYRFKNRFGAVDRPYRYFTKLFDPALQLLPSSVAKQEFPYFYSHGYKL